MKDLADTATSASSSAQASFMPFGLELVVPLLPGESQADNSSPSGKRGDAQARSAPPRPQAQQAAGDWNTDSEVVFSSKNCRTIAIFSKFCHGLARIAKKITLPKRCQGC